MKEKINQCGKYTEPHLQWNTIWRYKYDKENKIKKLFENTEIDNIIYLLAVNI